MTLLASSSQYTHLLLSVGIGHEQISQTWLTVSW